MISQTPTNYGRAVTARAHKQFLCKLCSSLQLTSIFSSLIFFGNFIQNEEKVEEEEDNSKYKQINYGTERADEWMRQIGANANFDPKRMNAKTKSTSNQQYPTEKKNRVRIKLFVGLVLPLLSNIKWIAAKL